MPGSRSPLRTSAGVTPAGTRRSSRVVTARRAGGGRRRGGRAWESQLMRWVILNGGRVHGGRATARRVGHVIFGRAAARVNEVGGRVERIRGRRRAVTGGTGRV